MKYYDVCSSVTKTVSNTVGTIFNVLFVCEEDGMKDSFADIDQYLETEFPHIFCDTDDIVESLDFCDCN